MKIKESRFYRDDCFQDENNAVFGIFLQRPNRKMDYQLKDKKVLVTGSTSGIGYAIAKLLLHEGAEVIINGRSKSRIDRSLEMLRTDLPESKVSGVEADFRDKSSVMALIDKIKSVDILINNVGIFKSQSFEETTDADWMEMIEVNVMSAVRLSRAFMPKMIQNNWGRIVFISSECAMLYNTPQNSDHCLS